MQTTMERGHARLLPTTHRILNNTQWDQIAFDLGLSPRETEIVQRLFDGATESNIAYGLGSSPHTVHTHIRRIHQKLGTCDQRELIVCIFATYLYS